MNTRTQTNPPRLALTRREATKAIDFQPISDTRRSEEEGSVGFWFAPAVIQENHFVFKSLSSWAFNVSVGCLHGCRFCYVPSATTIKLGPRLSGYGVRDADGEWGAYSLLRPWDEWGFLSSLSAAERTPLSHLKPDGNRAVMYCSTTDPYQTFVHQNAERQKVLNESARFLVRRSLELIRDRSTLNVRILTRSPLARRDFDLYRSFGNRLVFGMSLPTLRNDLARIYEPKAPAPSQRLATLRAARNAGLSVYVAVAPTYPECDEVDLRATLKAISEVDAITIFHEPINIRAENVSRIATHAKELGITLNTDVFATPESWRRYALASLRTVEAIAQELGLEKHLHLWPDKSLGRRSVIVSQPDPNAYRAWLDRYWSRISEWAAKEHDVDGAE